MKEWECFVAVDAMLLLFMVSAGVAARVFPVKSSRDFVSANCSQTAVSIGFTFYASSFGASLLYATPEVGAIAGIVGVIGNAVAATLPFFVFAVLGPYMQRNMDSHHATVSEYLPHRLGPWMSFQVSTISLFMMFIFIVAELSAVGDVIEYIVPQTEGAIHMASVSVVTTAYTCYGGFRASLLTDRFQGFITLFLSILVSVAIFRDVHVTSEEWESSGVLRSTAVGHRSAFTLAVAIVASILFHQGFWQRALAARDASTLRHGCLLAGLFVFPTVTLFGVVGMVAKADDEDVEPSLGFFHLLSQLRGSAWDYVTIILAVALVAGGVDSLQNGITSIIARDFLLNLPERITGKRVSISSANALKIARLLTLFINVPAILYALEGRSILDLYMIADLLACTSVAPFFVRPSVGWHGRSSQCCWMLCWFVCSHHTRLGYSSREWRWCTECVFEWV
eukprot:Rmarinus@m.26461